MGLARTVAIVPVGDDVAMGAVVDRLAAEGATIVLVTGGGEEAGRMASLVEGLGGTRPAVFHVGDDARDLDALVEFLGELYRDRA